MIAMAASVFTLLPFLSSSAALALMTSEPKSGELSSVSLPPSICTLEWMMRLSSPLSGSVGFASTFVFVTTASPPPRYRQSVPEKSDWSVLPLMYSSPPPSIAALWSSLFRTFTVPPVCDSHISS